MVPPPTPESFLAVEPSVDELLRQLAEARRDHEALLYAISHDLQAPVRGVLGFSRLLKERAGKDLGPEGGEFLDLIVEGGEQLQEMVQGLLRIARVRTRGRPFEPVELEVVLGDVLSRLESRLEACGALVRFGELPVVHADADQMAEALHCLLDNAIRFRAERPPVIEVTADREPGGWEISVRDNGRGFDPAKHDRVLDVFGRLLPAGEPGGIGVGLALCRRIVERHGGSLRAQSEPGRGSTFRFNIPEPSADGSLEHAGRARGGVGERADADRPAESAAE